MGKKVIVMAMIEFQIILKTMLTVKLCSSVYRSTSTYKSIA